MKIKDRSTKKINLSQKPKKIFFKPHKESKNLKNPFGLTKTNPKPPKNNNPNQSSCNKMLSTLPPQKNFESQKKYKKKVH